MLKLLGIGQRLKLTWLGFLLGVGFRSPMRQEQLTTPLRLKEVSVSIVGQPTPVSDVDTSPTFASAGPFTWRPRESWMGPAEPSSSQSRSPTQDSTFELSFNGTTESDVDRLLTTPTGHSPTDSSTVSEQSYHRGGSEI